LHPLEYPGHVTTTGTTQSEATEPDTHPAEPGRKTAVLVLAAGHGTRLKSALPKHLHKVGGIPIVQRVIQAGMGASPYKIAVIVSPGMADLDQRLGMPGAFETVIQHPARGTGDAVRCGLDAIDDDTEWIVSLLGDSCLLTAETVQTLLERAISEGNRVTVLTAILPDAQAYGRIDRDEFDRVIQIVEKKSDDPAKRVGETEINSGIMVLDARWAREALTQIELNPNSNEYQLTDLIGIAVRQHRQGQAWPVQTFVGDEFVGVGVNDRVQLMEADDIVRRKVRERLMAEGVTIIGPDTVFIDEDVEIGRDTVIHPFSTITGTCRIGENCTIGPAAHLRNVTIGNNVEIFSSTVRESTVLDNSNVGPYSHLRGGTVIREKVHIGSNTEIKASDIGSGSNVGHFGYLGDATLGEKVNIGAGTITANFNGKDKNPTTIGSGSFIGSDTVLVAPVNLGEQSRTGAGSVVTRDVEAGSLVVGVPAKPRAPKRPAGEE
jgi:bifunctional UDP-N-acetylglucosamine pyrophosphorylase/glucosamine-1-phosphate N-acetyltransferase